MAEIMEGCVMLALSTFRKSEKAVDTAIQKAQSTKKLLVVFVADVNLARYFIGAEHGLLPDLKEMCEADLLKLHVKEGRGHVEIIAAKARSEGIEMKAIVQIGGFATVCLDLVKQEKPSLIVTTRSQRPEWVKRFFGAPVNELVEKAGCPVMVV
jgi:nucleotide-binding universal stress UspA family protein